MLKSIIGLSIIASSVLAIDEVSVVENLSCKTFTTNDAVAGVYKYYNPEAKDWALYMPQIDYFLVHETGKALIADGAQTISSSDFSSIDSTGPIVLGDYTGDNTRADLLANSTMSIADNVAGIYNQFDAANNLWFLYMPALNYLLVHETGVTAVADGALNIDTSANFDNIEVNAATGAVTFVGKGGCGAVVKEEISGTITTNTTLTADKVWLLDGKVEVADGVVLTVEPGTTVAGKKATNGWLLVHPGAQLNAEGTAVAPILFTSEEAVDGEAESFGQWGGVTLVCNAGNDQTSPYEVDGTVPGTGNDTDSSGILTYVTLNNTGVEVVLNQEINGLSFVGVGSFTVVDNITVNRSGDDGIEIWGGTVALTNIVIDGAQDDSFDTDEGWTGSVDGLTITNGVKAGIEMSGTTRATYSNVDITLGAANVSEGGIYFKPGDNQEIGGVFNNVTITHNGADAAFGAIHSREKPGSSIDLLTTFDNVTLAGTNPTKFSGPYAATLETLFDNGTGNTK